MRPVHPSPRTRPRLIGLACGMGLCAAAAQAGSDPGYYVVTPYDDAGRLSLELRYWDARRGARQRSLMWPELGLAWGVNSRWTMRLLASGIGHSLDGQRLEALQWHNDVLLTQGEWPLDLALHSVLRRGFDGHGDALELGPVLNTDLGRTQLTAGLFAEQGLGRGLAGAAQLKYQWQLRQRWRPGLHWGLQGFGELGDWNRWSAHAAQSHRLGPALFVAPSGGQAGRWQWQAAWLQGKVYGRSGHMASLQAMWHWRAD